MLYMTDASWFSARHYLKHESLPYHRSMVMSLISHVLLKSIDFNKRRGYSSAIYVVISDAMNLR